MRNIEKNQVNFVFIFILVLISFSLFGLFIGTVDAREEAVIYTDTAGARITDWGFDIKGLGDGGDRAHQVT